MTPAPGRVYHGPVMGRAVLLFACAAALAPSLPADGSARPEGRPPLPAQAPDGWRTLEPGLDLGEFPAALPSPSGDRRITVLRIDPGRFRLALANASAMPDRRPRTAREWAEEKGFVAAINASMYQEDRLTSVSLMRSGGHVNNPRLSKDKAVLAFDRASEDVPPVQIIDRECQDFEALRPLYGTLVQSIRMVSCRGANVWSRQERRWSTAAVGMDGRGRVLFLFARSPFPTHDFIDLVLGLPIDLRGAMYVEGGPEAQLCVRAGGLDLEKFGSFETGFFESDLNARAWPVPNVIGVARLAAR